MLECLVGEFIVNCVENRDTLWINAVIKLIGIFKEHLVKILENLMLFLSQIQEHI